MDFLFDVPSGSQPCHLRGMLEHGNTCRREGAFQAHLSSRLHLRPVGRVNVPGGSRPRLPSPVHVPHAVARYGWATSV
ncbi:hypothetical protein SKAU_G00325660 [Synaphobranchus kaupii]|uniref:Uncharacterized protein n=1 Tax=Synaphobranchus kaupii TaxID=118154 RepID=A0A9Q1EPJ1_SYNKA|nr:hypothetical protein SKAU_G00325660 [Synaphobranchus kaupii]